MLPLDIAIRLATLQQRVYRCVEDELQKDSYHKSYEGAMEVTLCLPSIFEQHNGPEWIITLNAYVLPSDIRGASWRGKTLLEAVAVAESDIDKMCMDYEFARMDKHQSELVQDDDDSIPR